MKKKLSKLTFLAIISRIVSFVNVLAALVAVCGLAADGSEDWGVFVKQKVMWFAILLITSFLAVFFVTLSDLLKKEVKLIRKRSKKSFTSKERKLILYDLKKTE